jgi:AraC family transcriptional regulator
MTASHTGYIECRHVRTPVAGGVLTFKNSADTYILHAPLARTRARLERDGRTIHDGDVRAGMFGIVVPGEVRTIRVAGAGEGVHLWIPGPLFRHFLESEGRPPPVAIRGNALWFAGWGIPRASVEHLARAVLLVKDMPAHDKPLFLQSMVLGFAALLRASTIDPDDEDVRRSQGLSDTEFGRCKSFADAHIDGRVHLADWAAELNMSTSEFGRRFVLKTGMPPYHWLLKLRVERARTLVEESDLPLAAIALQVGFSSQSHLTDAFRKQFGAAPGLWRRNRRPR